MCILQLQHIEIYFRAAYYDLTVNPPNLIFQLTNITIAL